MVLQIVSTTFLLTLLSSAAGTSVRDRPAQPRMAHARIKANADGSPTELAQPTGFCGETVYDSLNSGGGPSPTSVALTAGPGGGTVGFDDYVTIEPGATSGIVNLEFIGGLPGTPLDPAAGLIFFTFFTQPSTTTFNPVASFGVSLSLAGNFIWIITFGGSCTGTFDIPNAGVFQMYANNNTDVGPVTHAFWFATRHNANSLRVGFNDPSFGPASGLLGGDPEIHMFRFAVPDPATLSLLGLGGLALARRERRRFF